PCAGDGSTPRPGRGRPPDATCGVAGWEVSGGALRGGSSGRLAARCLLADRLDVDLDADLVRHEQAARLDGAVSAEAPSPAIDRAVHAEPDTLVALRIRAAAPEHGFQLALHRLAADRQVPLDAEARALLEARAADLTAAKGDLRVALHIQEVLGAQVPVTVFVAGVDARGVDLDLDRGSIEVLLVHRDRAAEPLESAAHRRDHQVLDRE